MAKVGTGNASEYPPDGLSSAIAFAAITLSITMNASAHGGGLNAEGCHNERKSCGCHCDRGGGSSTHSDAALIDTLAPSWIAPTRTRASRDQTEYANFTETRAACALILQGGESGYGPNLAMTRTPWAASIWRRRYENPRYTFRLYSPRF